MLSHVCLFATPWDYILQGILQARMLEWVAFPFSRGSSQPRSNLPTVQADSLPAEPSEKPKNTGVTSLPLLQRIFLTQELNQGLLHCRQILCQLSHQGSLKVKAKVTWSCPALCDPRDYPVHGILQARILDWVAVPFSRGSSTGIEPRSPTLQADSLPAEPQGKPITR